MLAETIETGECNAKDFGLDKHIPWRYLGRQGTNFALYSENADEGRVVPVRLRPNATKETSRMVLPEQHRHGLARLPAGRICPGQVYGYRVHGPYEPAKGHRFNPNKILLDPYAKAIARETQWADEMFGYKVGDPEADLSFDDRDNAAIAPLAAVVDDGLHLGRRPAAPHTPWHKTIIYELHVKGFTKLQPERARELARHLRRARLRSVDRAT